MELVFFNSLLSVPHGGEVGLFSHDVVFIGHIFEKSAYLSLFVYLTLTSKVTRPMDLSGISVFE